MKQFINIIIILSVLFSISIETFIFMYGKVNLPNLPESIAGRLNYYYSYFTILSNITVGVSSFLLLINPEFDRKWFRILRLDGLICIMITCVVYNIILRPEHHPMGMMIYTNELLHVVIPTLSVVYWFMFGPHGKFDKKTLLWAIVPPLFYIFYIFIRGAITHIYPYPFLDAENLGLPQALLNTGGVVIVFFLFEFIFLYIDKRLLKKNRN